MLLTLVSSSNAENAATLWGFIGRYRPGVTPQTHPRLDAMVGYAINYYRDFVAPAKKFREPTDAERVALQDLRDALSQLPAESSAEEIQNVVYEIGRREPFLDPVKKGKDGRPGVSLDWFNMLYQVLLGQEKRPALRLLRCGLWIAKCGDDDRRRTGAVGVTLSVVPAKTGTRPPVSVVCERRPSYRDTGRPRGMGPCFRWDDGGGSTGPRPQMEIGGPRQFQTWPFQITLQYRP